MRYILSFWTKGEKGEERVWNFKEQIGNSQAAKKKDKFLLVNSETMGQRRL